MKNKKSIDNQEDTIITSIKKIIDQTSLEDLNKLSVRELSNITGLDKKKQKWKYKK